MAKEYTEESVLRAISRIAKINYSTKCISINKANAGLKTQGKLDFLINHCGWGVVYTNTPINNSDDYKSSTVRDAKKVAKEHKLTDKTKRNKR